MRISDWSSDVCSSDLRRHLVRPRFEMGPRLLELGDDAVEAFLVFPQLLFLTLQLGDVGTHADGAAVRGAPLAGQHPPPIRKTVLSRSGEVAVTGNALGAPFLDRERSDTRSGGTGCTMRW